MVTIWKRWTLHQTNTRLSRRHWLSLGVIMWYRCVDDLMFLHGCYRIILRRRKEISSVSKSALAFPLLAHSHLFGGKSLPFSCGEHVGLFLTTPTCPCWTAIFPIHTRRIFVSRTCVRVKGDPTAVHTYELHTHWKKKLLSDVRKVRISWRSFAYCKPVVISCRTHHRTTFLLNPAWFAHTYEYRYSLHIFT